MFKVKVKGVTSGETKVIESEGYIHTINCSENMDNALLSLIGMMFTLYSRLSENKQVLKDGVSNLKIGVSKSNPDIEHLADPETLFNYLELLDAQGYEFPLATSDFATVTKEALSILTGYTLVDTLVIYWAKTNPELIKRCPRFKNDDKFPFLYEEACKRGFGELQTLEKIMDRKDYDLKSAVQKHLPLTGGDAKVRDYVVNQWEALRKKLVEQIS